MFKEKINNIVNINNWKKRIASIIGCGILFYTSSASALEYNINTNIFAEDIPYNIFQPNIPYVNLSSTIYMEATAYSPDEGGIITASGHNLYDIIGWGCASNDFPIGTELYIECPSAPWINGVYTVLDTGSMGSGVVDIAMNNIDECYSFGRRAIYVTVL